MMDHVMRAISTSLLLAGAALIAHRIGLLPVMQILIPQSKAVFLAAPMLLAGLVIELILQWGGLTQFGPKAKRIGCRASAELAVFESSEIHGEGSLRDRSLISLKEPREVRYWTETLGVSAAELERAVAQVGPGAEQVRAYLGNIMNRE